MDTGKTAIREKLMSAVASVDLDTWTVEQAELAAAQMLTAQALSGNSRADLQSLEGKLYAPEFPKVAVWETGYVNTACNYHPPKIVNDFLAFGGAQGTSYGGTTAFLFIAGPVTGKKRVYSSGVASACTKLQHAATCFDPENQIAYHPTQEMYFGYANTATGATGIAYRNEIAGQVVAAAYHPVFKKSYVAVNAVGIWSADDILTAHTAVSLPDMTGVYYSATTGHIACTDTAVLAFTQQRGHATKGIQRSTDGATFENIAGIPGAVEAAVIYTSEFYAGRLWVAMAGALYSTADNGDTWRTDIDAAANIRRLGYDSTTDTVIAWGPDGVWHVAGATASKVSGTAISYTGSFYAETHRCIYSSGSVYSDSGSVLLDSADFQIDPYADQYSNVFDQVDAVIPHGGDRIWQLAAMSSNQAYAGVIEQAFGIYLPPRGGAQVEITAIGSGGTINVGTAINGLDTVVSNLAIAAGGDHSDVATTSAASANQGERPVCLAGAGNGGTYIWKGGPGFAYRGKTYGDGETVTGNSTAHPPASISGFTGLDANDRGGWSGAIATWQGFTTDPVPMLPAQPVYDSAAYGKSGPGAVIIKEL